MKISSAKMRQILTLAALTAEAHPEIQEWQDIPEIRNQFYKEGLWEIEDLILDEMPF